MKKIITTLCNTFIAITCLASPLEFSYNFAAAPSEGYGSAKNETYDVAIRLDNPSFTGAKVTGLRVAIPDNSITDVSAWLSTTLQLKKKNGKNINNPDIAIVECSAVNGWLDVEFETPYTIPAEGVYVGYSFTVTSLNETTETPVSVAAGSCPDALYLHSSRTKLRWGVMSEELGKVSTMVVKLEGSFPEQSAIFSIGEIKTAATKATTASLQIINCGTASISSVEYTATVNGHTLSGMTVPDNIISGNISATGKTTIDIPTVNTAGEYPLRIKVTKVNGISEECPETEGILRVYPFLPVNRPLVEEYTGLWCGWCPKGYVALETMKERKGDLFIAIAYHNGDAMEFTGKTPNSPGGYPAAYINRSTSININDIYTDWDNFRTWIPEGSVDVNIDWTDESHTAIKATATARFIENHSNADYRLSYILVADGLSNPRWKQHNSYSGNTDKKDEMPGQLGDIFINGERYVEGLTFNDVAIATTDYDGAFCSIPAEIVAGDNYTHSHIFNLEGISTEVLSMPDKLRVVAVMTDGRSGKFINCNSSLLINGKPFTDTSSVENISVNYEPTEVGRWTLDGRHIKTPVKGINIVRYSDGTTRKIIVK